MSANMDLVTSHRGVAHITTQNVIDLIAGLSGDISGVKIFPQLYDGLDNVIESTTRVKIKTGAGLAGGYFFILNEAFNWNLDPGSVGYSRIDVLYLVIYEDYGTTVQSSDLVYRVGTAYPNGQSGQVPSAPSGTNIIATFPLLRANMTDGALVDTMSYADLYESNSSINAAIAQMRVDFQVGVDTVIGAIQSKGVTLSGSTPFDCVTGVNKILVTLMDYASSLSEILYPGRYPVISNVESAMDDIYVKGKADGREAAESVTMTSELYLSGSGSSQDALVATTFNTQNVISIKCKYCTTITGYNGIEVQTLAEATSSTPIRNVILAVNQELTFTSEEKYVYIRAYGNMGAARATIDVKMRAKKLRGEST